MAKVILTNEVLGLGSAGDVVTVVLPEQRRETQALLRRAGIQVAPQQVTAESAAVQKVAGEVAAQIAAGDARITGLMIESHLQEGRQDIVPGQPLAQGVSVTDACISMAQTVPVLEGLAAAVRARRARA